MDPTRFDLTLIWVPVGGGRPRAITSLADVQSAAFRYPVDQLYFTANPARVHVGLRSWGWMERLRPHLPSWGGEHSSEFGGDPADVAGVLSPDGRRALITRKYALFELTLPGSWTRDSQTLDIDRARDRAVWDGNGGCSSVGHGTGTLDIMVARWGPHPL